MACTARSNVRQRWRLGVAGAVVFTALMAATARASVPPVEAPAAGPTRPVSSPGTTGTSANSSPTPTSTRVAARPAPGFLLERGRFIPVAVPPGTEDVAPPGIAPIDVNDRVQIVGSYADARGDAHGFLLDRGPRAGSAGSTCPAPRAPSPRGSTTAARSSAKYSDVSGAVSSGVPVRGFLLDRGRYVRLDVPGAVSSQALDINDRGQVVGEYQAAAGVFHGYVWERGRFRTIEAGSALGINNRGQITGVRIQPDGTFRGFLLDRGRFTTFTVPGAQVTVPYGITDQGQIVGLSASSPTATTGSGFLRDARGRITAINRPGKSITIAFDINNRGQIVGIAVNPEDLAGAQPTDTPPMGAMPRVLMGA